MPRCLSRGGCEIVLEEKERVNRGKRITVKVVFRLGRKEDREEAGNWNGVILSYLCSEQLATPPSSFQQETTSCLRWSC